MHVLKVLGITGIFGDILDMIGYREFPILWLTPIIAMQLFNQRLFPNRGRLLRALVALIGVTAIGVQGLQAQDIKFSELEKKITVDSSPVKSPGAAPSTYAPALEKVMPAVVTIFANKSIKLTSNPSKKILRPVVFVDIETNPAFEEGLVRVSGVVAGVDGNGLWHATGA